MFFQHYPTPLRVSLMFLNVYNISPTLLIVLGIFLALPSVINIYLMSPASPWHCLLSPTFWYSLQCFPCVASCPWCLLKVVKWPMVSPWHFSMSPQCLANVSLTLFDTLVVPHQNVLNVFSCQKIKIKIIDSPQHFFTLSNNPYHLPKIL